MILQPIADALPLVFGAAGFFWLAGLLVVFSLCRMARRGDAALYEREEPVRLRPGRRPLCSCRGIVGDVGPCDGACASIPGMEHRARYRRGP